LLTAKQKLYRGQPPRVSPLITTPPSHQDQVATESVKSPSPFNDESNVDTTFGQVSNAYDSTAMTRSLNIEVGSFPNGGSSLGANVRKAFEEMMLMRQQGVEIKGINKFEIRKDSHKAAVRPPWTPPNSPKSQRENIAVEGAPSENEVPVSTGRR
jgi:hypothetical protein